MNKTTILALLSTLVYCISANAQPDAVYIDSARRVVIGINTPQYKLDVEGHVRAAGDITADKDLTVKGALKATGKIETDNSLVAKGTIKANGKIEADDSLITKRGIKAALDIVTDNNIRLNGTHIVYNSANGVINWGEHGRGALIFRNLTDGQGDIGRYKDLLIITSDGRVSLGSASNEPNIKLLVNGAIKLGLGNKLFWDWDNRAIDVAEDNDGVSRVMRFSNSMAAGSHNPKGGFSFVDESGVTAMRIVDYKVGIGTNTPQVPLSVTKTKGGNDNQNYTTSREIKHNYEGVMLNDGGRNFGNCSIYGTGDVVSNGAMISTSQQNYSDIRLKKDIHLTSSANDLATLNRIEVVDYKMIDTIADNRHYKKAIAQQVQAVYPQAVSPYSYYLPSVFQPATCVENEAANIYKITVATAHNLATGDHVKLKCYPGSDIIVDVKEIVSPTQFTATSETEISASTSVFVYGKETDDLLTVDYSALSMLNISATQELIKTIELQQQKIALLQHNQQTQENQNRRIAEENQAMKTSLEHIEARINALETQTGNAGGRVTVVK